MVTAASEPQRQQSWTAWLLDAYANSVAPEPCEETDDSYDSLSPTTSDFSTTDSVSPYGPYVRTGRGGAGNYQWQSQQRPDLEAQRPISLKEKRKAAIAMESIDTSTAIRNAQARSASQHAHVGRGGAGTYGPYMQSNQPQASQLPAHSPPHPSLRLVQQFTPEEVAPAIWSAARSVSNLAKLEKEREEQAEAERRRATAELEVVSLLQPPSQAYISTRRRSTLPEDFESSGYA